MPIKVKILLLWLLKKWKLWLLKIEYDDKIYQTDMTNYRTLGGYLSQVEGLEGNYKFKKKAIEVNYDANIYFLKYK